MIKYYWRVIKWLWAHRGETNCRQKHKRMLRELDGIKQRRINCAGR